MVRRLLGACCLLGVAAAAGGAAEPTVIVDETAYWRYWLYGGPMPVDGKAMKRQAKDLFTERGLAHRKRNFLRALAKAGGTTQDWMMDLTYPAGYLNLRRMNEVTTAPPPDDWPATDFDDRDWSCYRKPFKMAKDFYLDGFVDHFYHIKTTYFRTTFEVASPAAAGDLELRLVYRGGVRALLNGREVARGHLAAAAKDAAPRPADLADAYPAEAYFALKGEHPGLTEKRMAAWTVGEKVIAPDMNVFATRPDAFENQGTSDRVPEGFRRLRALGYGGRCYVNRAGWDRLARLRNRELNVRIPAAKLRKGVNVLAVEVHTAGLHPVALRWRIPWEGNAAWKHGWLMRVRLSGRGQGVRPAMRRPAGVQVWAVDVHHRLYSPEFCPPGPPPRALRVVGARNGTYSSQFAVGTDSGLADLRARVSDFAGPAGRKLPASIARVLYPVGHPEWELKCAGEGKGYAKDAIPGFSRGNALVTLDRYSKIRNLILPAADEEAAALQLQLREQELKRIEFFDHLSAATPPPVPRDSSRPVWVSVDVPADAPAGRYRATVTVEAGGMDPTTLPLELRVADWRVPEPRRFQPIMCLEQSPYAVARHYKSSAAGPRGAGTPGPVVPWSEEHFRLMERSFELLAEVGNDFLAVPLVARTEFGNSADSPVRIYRTADGGLRFDFAIVDRYLDMAAKHWGKPYCVAFVVDHCGPVPYGQTIHVIDPATGRARPVQIGAKAPEERRRRVWRAIAAAVRDYMDRRGLGKSLHWGVHGDAVNDPTLPKLLREFAPNVTWVRYSHQYRPDDTYTLCANVRGAYFLPTSSLRGWRALTGRINLWLPRHWNSVAVAEGKSAPFAYRLGIERALVSGAPGLARMGADYWDGTWLHDFPVQPYCGMPILFMLYPGRDGAESSVRYEMLREGLQATEARIFLERAVDKIADPALTREITALLDKRIHDTLFALVFAPHVKIEEYHSGWQSRSAALYAAAARVAGRIGVSAARNRLDIDLPARGSKRIAVDLRNWTGAKREWKVAAVHDWLRPARTSGSLGAGSEPLAIDVDADALEPGEPATGLLMLTDVRTGRTETVAVDARVSDVFRFSGPQRAINVGVGRSGSMAFTLLNPSGAELAWRITGQPGWLKVAPSTGRLAPGRQCGIALTAAPPDRRRAVHDVELTLAEAGGAVRRERLRVHVLPHRRPHDRRPAGRAVHLQDVPADAVVEYVNGGRKMNLRHGVRFYKPDPRRALAIGRKTPTDWRSMLKKYTRGIELSPRGELTYNIEGKGFTAFSAEVGWSSRSRIGREVRWSPRLHFELYVDGRLVDHSGLMDITDGPRLLVAEGLRSAKRIRLVTRFHNDGLLPAGLTLDGQVGAPGVWGDPRLHR